MAGDLSLGGGRPKFSTSSSTTVATGNRKQWMPEPGEPLKKSLLPGKGEASLRDRSTVKS
eukprot:1064183-Karenia_brevis.AAC.1